MRKFILICVWMWAMGAVAQEPIELITYNIRMNTSGDGVHAWPHRKQDVAALFRFHRAAVFCVQEALPEQMDDLANAFPDFSYEGVGRDDGKREGEFSAVFYDHARFKKLDGGTLLTMCLFLKESRSSGMELLPTPVIVPSFRITCRYL